jgi:acetyl/propionyl-CoA carboxylase alpha subunit
MGVRTNRTFLRGVLDSDVFREGRMTTPLLDRWAAGEGPFPLAQPATALDFATAAGTLALAPGGDWFRSTGIAECPIVLTADGETRHCTVRFVRGRLANVEVEGETVPFDTFSASMPEIAWSGPAGVGRALAVVDGRDLWLDRDGRTRVFTEPDDLAGHEPAADPSRVVSPVSGLVRVVEVEVGSQVEAGQTLVVIEAMKMETTLQAMIAGTVRSLRVARGQQARAGDLLVEIEAR